MTPRRPTPRRTSAFCALLVGVLAVMGLVGCTDPPAVPPDAARKDVAAETGDLGDALADAPDAPTDVRNDRADARADVFDADVWDAGDAGPEVVFEDVELLTREDLPPGYDIQLDRSGDAPAGVTLVALDVSEFYTDRPVDGGPRVPCTPSAIEVCACVDGREGWQVCEVEGRFSTCMCDTLPAPPFPLPPRLVFPPNGSRVTSQRPTVRWALPTGVARARVELCADRPCATVLVRQEVADTAWRPTARLAPGVVFWRVRGLDAGGAVVWTSATWYFQVRARDSAVDTAYGRIRDFNGDGYDDFFVVEDDNIKVFLGSPAGVGAEPSITFRPTPDGSEPPNFYGFVAADMTGDGLTDLVIAQSEPWREAPISASVYAGDPLLPLGRRVARFNHLDMVLNSDVPLVDHDGDGYLDLIAEFRVVLHGGPGGGIRRQGHPSLSDIPRFPLDINRDGYVEYATLFSDVSWSYGRVPLPSSERLPVPYLWNHSSCPVATGDFDGDQFGDLVGLCLVQEGMNSSHLGLMSISGAGVTLRRSAIQRASPTVSVDRWQWSSQGDLDGDGFVDLVLAHASEGVYWLRGGTHGVSPHPHMAFATDNLIKVLNVGDMNGDGCDETAIQRCDSGSRSLTIIDGGPSWSGRATRLQFSRCFEVR